MFRWLFAFALIVSGLESSTFAHAGERVSVSGSNTTFDAKVDRTVAGKEETLKLTGAALRKKAVFNVYAIASYVDEDATPGNADELANANVAKALQLVMEREVPSRDMHESIQANIKANYPNEPFQREFKQLSSYLDANPPKKADSIWITHVPDTGVSIQIGRSRPTLIEGQKFSRAIWEIYFGRTNLGPTMKAPLSSRL